VISEFKDILIEEFEINELTYNDRLGSIFEQYASFLVSENKKYNLTKITSLQDIVDKHFIDSILGFEKLKYSDFNTEKLTLMDIGTGAGFPGVPLIFYDWFCNDRKSIKKVHLIDSNKKKTDFLKFLFDNLSNPIDEDAFVVHNDRVETLDLYPIDCEKDKVPLLFLSRATGDINKVLRHLTQHCVQNNNHHVSLLYYGSLSAVNNFLSNKETISNNEVSNAQLKEMTGLRICMDKVRIRQSNIDSRYSIDCEIIEAYRFSKKEYTRISVLYKISKES